MVDNNDCPSCQDLPGLPVPGQEDVYAFAMPVPPDDQLTPWHALRSTETGAGSASDRPPLSAPTRPRFPDGLFDIDAAPEPGPAMATTPRVEYLPPLNAPGHQWPIQQQVQQPQPMTGVLQDPHDPSVTYLPPLGAPWHPFELQQAPSPQPQDPEPRRPPEPATRDDCDKWAQEYVEWLEEHGDSKETDRITVRCNNRTYVFDRNDPRAIPRWSCSVVSIDRDISTAVQRELGDPIPSEEWADPDDQADFDEEWERLPAPDLDDNFRPKNPVLLGTSENCDLLKVRFRTLIDGILTRKFAFEYEYIVSDKVGEPDDEAVESYRKYQHVMFAREMDFVGGTTGHYFVPLPSESHLKADLTFWADIVAGMHFVCEPPCKLATRIVSWAFLGFGRSRSEEPTTQVIGRSKQDGYWKVLVRSEGSVSSHYGATIVVDAYCTK